MSVLTLAIVVMNISFQLRTYLDFKADRRLYYKNTRCVRNSCKATNKILRSSKPLFLFALFILWMLVFKTSTPPLHNKVVECIF